MRERFEHLVDNFDGWSPTELKCALIRNQTRSRLVNALTSGKRGYDIIFLLSLASLIQVHVMAINVEETGINREISSHKIITTKIYMSDQRFEYRSFDRI